MSAGRNVDGWELPMRKSIQFRWIEQAEARSVHEHAVVQRAQSEPKAGVTYVETNPTWFDIMRELARPIERAVARIRAPLGDKMIKISARPALIRLSTDAEHNRVLVAILITDIVDSTRQVAELGDREWRVILDRHAHATRYEIKRFGGREVGNRGDGFLGIFATPARAVRCAAAITETIMPLGISLRCGIHVGEVDLKNGEISGIAVHIAARIATTARPGEAFVSKMVRDLVTGSGLVFEDRGIHQLRGLPDEIHLYATRAASPSQAAAILQFADRIRA
jgi:class 3 adenylate cyclase